jgi:hypothetical protein
VEKKNGYKPDTAWDMRKVFEDKDIHAVTFAVPNHWHALAASGPPRPASTSTSRSPPATASWEGRQMVQRRPQAQGADAGRVPEPLAQERPAAVQFIKEGKLGKVYRARGPVLQAAPEHRPLPGCPMAADAKPIPMVKNDCPYTASYLEKVHYDNWIGPGRPPKPFNPNRFHYNWHWQFEYGGGDTANQGPHQFDVARWGLGREDYPVRVRSTGGLFLYKDSQQDTPNEQTSLFEYADGTILEFGTRGLPTNKEGGHLHRGDLLRQ